MWAIIVDKDMTLLILGEKFTSYSEEYKVIKMIPTFTFTINNSSTTARGFYCPSLTVCLETQMS